MKAGAPSRTEKEQCTLSRRGTGVRLPVVGAKPVERHVQLSDVSAKEHKVPNLEETQRSKYVTGSLQSLCLYPIQEPSGSHMARGAPLCPIPFLS